MVYFGLAFGWLVLASTNSGEVNTADIFPSQILHDACGFFVVAEAKHKEATHKSSFPRLSLSGSQVVGAFQAQLMTSRSLAASFCVEQNSKAVYHVVFYL